MKIRGNVVVGVPVCGPPSWPLTRTLVGLQPQGEWTLVEAGQPDRPYPIGVARNKLAAATLKSGAEWLLNLDQDAVLHPLTLERLMSWGEPIVGALAFSRYPPPQPTIYAGYEEGEDDPGWRYCQIAETREWLARHEELHTTNSPAIVTPRPPDALRPVGFTGCHCLLVRRDVLVAIREEYGAWFERQTDIENRGTGIDRDFCRKARQLGYRVYVDRSVIAGHWGARSVGALDFLAFDHIADWGEAEGPGVKVVE